MRAHEQAKGQPPASHASLSPYFCHPSFHPLFQNVLTDAHTVHDPYPGLGRQRDRGHVGRVETRTKRQGSETEGTGAWESGWPESASWPCDLPGCHQHPEPLSPACKMDSEGPSWGITETTDEATER